jgi:hypothetical protein
VVKARLGGLLDSTAGYYRSLLQRLVDRYNLTDSEVELLVFIQFLQLYLLLGFTMFLEVEEHKPRPVRVRSGEGRGSIRRVLASTCV